jgi:hypothetical protein
MDDDPEIRGRSFLGASTYIQFGMLCAIIGGTWFISQTLSTLAGQVKQLNDSVITLLGSDHAQTMEIQSFASRISVIEAGGTPQMRDWQAKMIEFEKIGSPALTPRITALEREMIELKARNPKL